MSFGLTRGRALDPGRIGLTLADLPPMPDELAVCPDGAQIDLRAWFEHPERPLELEIGAGKGTFLVQQAELQPETNFIGVEWAREFWSYAADRIRRRNLSNVRLLHADASEFLRWRVPDATLAVIHLYFPDPWPKSRHHKRRMLNDRFLAEAHRALVDRGEVRIVTDHDDYWAWMEEHFARWTSPQPDGSPAPFERLAFDRPPSAGEGEVVGTNFERKYRREGRPFHATTLRKRGD